MDHVDNFSLSLGALIAVTAVLLVLVIVSLVLFRAVASFFQRFQSMGAERVNGRVQVRGLFEQEPSPQPSEEISVNDVSVKVNNPDAVVRVFKDDLDRIKLRNDEPS